MPRVPVETPQISTNVPGVETPSPSSMGQVGTALAQVGGTVAQTGLNIVNQIATADAKDAAMNSYFEYKLKSQRELDTMKLNSPDGYVHENDDPNGAIVRNPDNSPRTIAQQFRAYANNEYQTRQELMPNRLAAELFKEQANPFISEQVISTENDVKLMSLKSITQKSESRIQAAGDVLVSRPDVTDLYSHVNDLEQDIQSHVGILYDQTEADRRKVAMKQHLSKNLFEGAYSQILESERMLGKKGANATTMTAEIKKWLGVLDGNDQHSNIRSKVLGKDIIASMMDPNQKAAERDKLLHLLPVARARDKTDWNIKFANSVSAAKIGKSDPTARKILLDEIAGFVQAGEMGPYEGLSKVSELLSGVEIGRIQGPAYAAMSDSAKESVRQAAIKRVMGQVQAAYANRFGAEMPQDMGGIAANEIYNEFKSFAEREENKKKSDFGAYVMGRADNGQPILPSMNAMALRIKPTDPISFGKPENVALIRAATRESKTFHQSSDPTHPEIWRPFSKEWSQNISRFLTGDMMTNGVSTNADQAAQGLRSIQTAWGSDYPRVIQQMIEDGHLSPQWTIAMYNPTISGSKHLVAALRNEKTIMGDFEAKVKGSNGSFTENDLNVAVEQYIKPFVDDRMASDPYAKTAQNFGSFIRSAVKTNAAQLFSTRGGSSVGDIQQAAKDSYNELLGDFIKLGDPNAGWFSAGLKKPPILPTNLVTPEEHQRVMSNLKSLLTPEKLKALGAIEPPLANGQPGPFGDKFYEQVTASPNDPHFVFTNRYGEPGFNLRYRGGLNGMDTLVQSGTAKNPVPLFIPLEQMKRVQKEDKGFLDSIKNLFSGGNKPVQSTVGGK